MTASASPWSSRGDAYRSSEPHLRGPSLPKIAALLRPGPDDRILDLGTGAGHAAGWLAPMAAHVVGVDPEEDMLAAARAAYGWRRDVSFVRAGAERLPFPDDSFDAVVARHTLHHHADVDASLAEVRRVLRVGGRFVLADECPPEAELASWFERLQKARDPSHVRTRSPAEWSDAIARAGLTWVVGDARTRYRIDVPSWVARAALSPAEADRVRRMLVDAPPRARQALAIAVDRGVPVSFELPVAVALSIKEPRAEEAGADDTSAGAGRTEHAHAEATHVEESRERLPAPRSIP